MKKNKNINCKANPKYSNPIENVKKIDISEPESKLTSQVESSTQSVSTVSTDYTELSILGSPYFWGVGKCKK